MPRIACRICRRTFHISCSLALSRKRVSPNFISTPTKFETLCPLSPSRYHTSCVQFNACIHGRERGRRKGGEERTRTVSHKRMRLPLSDLVVEAGGRRKERGTRKVRDSGNRVEEGKSAFRPARSRKRELESRTPLVHSTIRAAGFPDFGRRGWTRQADRLPWRPYGLIRANIISEDARKNRRISENSFGQLVGFLFFSLSFSLPPRPSGGSLAPEQTSGERKEGREGGRRKRETEGGRFTMSIGRWLRSFASRGRRRKRRREEGEEEKRRHSALTRNEAELRETREKKKGEGNLVVNGG